MDPLTKRQAQILAYITDFIQKEGYAPSYREIGEHFNLSSTATVAEHVESLRQKGHLTYEERLARSIQVVPDLNLSDMVAVPLLGAIAAGRPIEAVVTSETIEIPRDMMAPNVYALRVKGDSMIKDGILSGDYVIIQQTNQAKNGEIVVALLENESVTLKRFYRERDHIRLQPANDSYEPIRVKQVSIQGKVRGLIRKFA